VNVGLGMARDRIRGSLLAGAVGDALGAPVEFVSWSEIRDGHGPRGVTGYLPAFGRPGGAITDDTQMTLFTAEGLIRSYVRYRHHGGGHRCRLGRNRGTSTSALRPRPGPPSGGGGGGHRRGHEGPGHGPLGREGHVEEQGVVVVGGEHLHSDG